MDANTLENIKNSLRGLEAVLSEFNSVNGTFRKNPRFKKAFSEAQKSLGALENEWILDDPEAFNSRDAIANVIEELEVIEAYVSQKCVPDSGDTLSERLKKAKAILAEVNSHINPKQ